MKTPNFIKKWARKVLRSELNSLTYQVRTLTEKNAEKERFINSRSKAVLPKSLVTKIIDSLGNPNAIYAECFSDSTMKKEMNHEFCTIPLGERSISYRLSYIVRDYADNVFALVFDVAIRQGEQDVYHEFILKATKTNFGSDNADITTWTWNLGESGLHVVPDDVYLLMDGAFEGWRNIAKTLLW